MTRKRAPVDRPELVGQPTSIRVSRVRRNRYLDAAARLGIDNLSEFVLTSLDGVAGIVASDGWECRLVHLNDDKIVFTGEATPLDPSGCVLQVASFPVIAPKAFWRHLSGFIRA